MIWNTCWREWSSPDIRGPYRVQYSSGHLPGRCYLTMTLCPKRSVPGRHCECPWGSGHWKWRCDSSGGSHSFLLFEFYVLLLYCYLGADIWEIQKERNRNMNRKMQLQIIPLITMHCNITFSQSSLGPQRALDTHAHVTVSALMA